MAINIDSVAEMQGLYGPFTLTEKVVQKIWLRGDFDRTRLVLADGRPLEIRAFGAWNLLGGPDFRGAQLVIGGESIIGDIEVHFHVADWRAHQHETDRAYNHVALHVVLFPPRADERPAVRGDGREIPTLVLLPLLHRDLEEYASDEALEVITARDAWEKFAGLAATPPEKLPGLLREKAADRWRQKVRFAKLRIERVGWKAAAHCTALEILGYRHNRAAMLTVATKYPLEAWAGGVGLRRSMQGAGRGGRRRACGRRTIRGRGCGSIRLGLRRIRIGRGACGRWRRLCRTLPGAAATPPRMVPGSRRGRRDSRNLVARHRPGWHAGPWAWRNGARLLPATSWAGPSAARDWTTWCATVSCRWPPPRLEMIPESCGFTGFSGMCPAKCARLFKNWAWRAVAPPRFAMVGGRDYWGGFWSMKHAQVADAEKSGRGLDKR
jgi:hypothetical protein